MSNTTKKVFRLFGHVVFIAAVVFVGICTVIGILIKLGVIERI